MIKILTTEPVNKLIPQVSLFCRTKMARVQANYIVS